MYEHRLLTQKKKIEVLEIDSNCEKEKSKRRKCLEIASPQQPVSLNIIDKGGSFLNTKSGKKKENVKFDFTIEKSTGYSQYGVY